VSLRHIDSLYEAEVGRAFWQDWARELTVSPLTPNARP